MTIKQTALIVYLTNGITDDLITIKMIIIVDYSCSFSFSSLLRFRFAVGMLNAIDLFESWSHTMWCSIPARFWHFSFSQIIIFNGKKWRCRHIPIISLEETIYSLAVVKHETALRTFQSAQNNPFLRWCFRLRHFKFRFCFLRTEKWTFASSITLWHGTENRMRLTRSIPFGV